MKYKAYAKINLNLIVLDKREDNKHNIESVFHKIDLFDEIEITKNDLGKCVIICNNKDLEDDNLIYKAFTILNENYDICGVDVKLNKRIPMQAGLGGGSSDCATFIKGMNDLFDLKITNDDLVRLFAPLGADIVPCYYDVPLLAKGVGEKVREIKSNLEFNLVLVKPNINCNTGEMYKRIDDEGLIDRNNNSTNKILQALENGDVTLLSDNLYNTFEAVVDLKSVKEDIMNTGALNTLLSGSGSSVFGIYENYDKALRAFHKLQDKYQTFLCKSINIH